MAIRSSLMGVAATAALVLIPATATPALATPAEQVSVTPSAAKPGFHKASAVETKRFLRALRKTNPDPYSKSLPAACIAGNVANSSSNWFLYALYYTAPNGRDCSQWFADGQSLRKITSGGRLVDMGYNLPFASCGELSAKIRQNGGSKAVIGDVKAAGLCR